MIKEMFNELAGKSSISYFNSIFLHSWYWLFENSHWNFRKNDTVE